MNVGGSETLTSTLPHAHVHTPFPTSYLSALALAVKLNRTLVAPPFVFYDRAPGQISLRPIETVFHLGRVREHHPIIPLAQFMAELAPTVRLPNAAPARSSAMAAG